MSQDIISQEARKIYVTWKSHKTGHIKSKLLEISQNNCSVSSGSWKEKTHFHTGSVT